MTEILRCEYRKDPRKDPLKEYNESPYRWWMFHVVGELKENPDYDERKGFVQLVGYVREIFSAQPGRRFVHGFSLYGDCMRCWVFDRVGAVGSELFSINRSPELFCRTIAAYTTMNLEELGFDTTMKVLEYNTSKSFEDLEIFNPTNEAHRMRKHITLLVERPGVQGNQDDIAMLDAGTTVEMGPVDVAAQTNSQDMETRNSPLSMESDNGATQETQQFVLEKLGKNGPHFRKTAVVSRGTFCFKACSISDFKTSKGQKWNCLVKMSWRSEERVPEGDYLSKTAGLPYLAEYITHGDV